MMAVNKKYDIVVFGASGYTGQYVVEEMARLQKEENITFAIAGRNQAKLEKVLVQAGKFSGFDVAATPIIIADVADENSLNTMASLARVVINCVGPYRFYGEQVVRACVENGCHHVDISGEPQYLERMSIEYHEAAKQNNVYVVGACGFDSIPNDMGSAFLIKNFKGDVNSIESYLDVTTTASRSKRINFGTWLSAVHGIANNKELKPLRKKIFQEKIPKSLYPLKSRGYIHKSPVKDSWCIPFLGSDNSIMKRSQYYRYVEEKKRPVQTKTYYTSGSFIASFFTILFGIMFGIMSMFEFTRNLLIKFPTFMSMGFITKDGPSRDDFSKTNFSITLIGKGWDETLEDPQQQHDSKPNKTMVVEVKGGEPGYLTTSMCIVQAAIVLLKDKQTLPHSGGVYTTAAAFTKTSLLDRLHNHGLEMAIKE